ncbi:MAG: ankyrin repeat domain-containing protein [Gammaproteobacteria bacterium]|nr:ankyrin repeat domain-containing protein [Gammaproteobacteria bacterium]
MATTTALASDSYRQPDAVHSNGKTALMQAARDGNEEIVRRLLRSGVDVNRQNTNGGTAIMYAALGDRLAITRILVDQGADVDARASNGWSALMIAAVKGHAAIARFLVAHGADPDAMDIYRWTPLMRAAYARRREMVGLLLDQQVDVNHQAENGITALHVAAERGLTGIAGLLTARGARRDLKDAAGRTPGMTARASGRSNPELLALLEDGRPTPAP